MLLAAVQRSGARRWGVGVSCLLHTERHRSGPACSMRVGLHKVCAAAARRQVQCHARARERVTMETLVSYELGPPTEEASLLLKHSNIRFASCVPFKAIFFWVLWALINKPK